MQPGGVLVLHWCDDCAGIRAFEAPPCHDGHAECPELACLECGAVVVLAVLMDDRLVGDRLANTGLVDDRLTVDPGRRTTDARTADSWALPRSA